MMRRRVVRFGIAATIAAGVAVGLPAHAASATCSVSAQSTPASCTFTAKLPAESVWTGYVAVTNDKFTIVVDSDNPRDTSGRYTNWQGTVCQINLWNRTPSLTTSTGTVSRNGTSFSHSGSGEGSLDFTPWCTYRLTVNSGVATAGETGEETAA
jgi:hypothetical protein